MGWGRVGWVCHVGVGWGVSCRGGVRWGGGEQCRGGVGHVGVRWHLSCRGGWVGWIMKSTGWGVMCYVLVENLFQCNLTEN